MKTKTIALCLALGACTHAADVSRPLTEVADKNAKFEVQNTAAGFSVELSYSRYQFIPEAGALIAACRSLVLARAREEAKSRNREIEPIDEQTVRVSTGRNIVTARTSCRAFVEVSWSR
jgi:hypothetical protein